MKKKISVIILIAILGISILLQNSSNVSASTMDVAAVTFTQNSNTTLLSDGYYSTSSTLTPSPSTVDVNVDPATIQKVVVMDSSNTEIAQLSKVSGSIYSIPQLTGISKNVSQLNVQSSASYFMWLRNSNSNVWSWDDDNGTTNYSSDSSDPVGGWNSIPTHNMWNSYHNISAPGSFSVSGGSVPISAVSNVIVNSATFSTDSEPSQYLSITGTSFISGSYDVKVTFSEKFDYVPDSNGHYADPTALWYKYFNQVQVDYNATTYFYPNTWKIVAYLTTPAPSPTPTPTPSTITGDFQVNPSTINYRDSFTLHPLSFTLSAGCTYTDHYYKIERGGSYVTTAKVTIQTQDTTFTYSTYPSIIAVGSHNISLMIEASCGNSGWISTHTLTVNGPASNSPPDFKVGWVDPNNNKVPLSQAIVGTTLDLIYINDPSVPTPSDPDGDAIYWDDFNFNTADAWTKTVPTKSGVVHYIDGYHSVKMDSLGYHMVQASMHDQWGGSTTRTATINVVAPNPVPVITGPSSVVEGRPVTPAFSSQDSYSPYSGRTIDHTKDVWGNKKSVYTIVGTEIITLDVTDSTGLASRPEDQAKHTLTVKADLPPTPQLSFTATAVRNVDVSFSNTSYSPDGDQIVQNTVTYWYDSNNDGSQSGESVSNITMDANKNFVFKPTKVGKYHFIVFVKEDWGKTATKDFVLDVVNDSPTVSFSTSSTSVEPIAIPTTAVSTDQILTWDSVNDYSSIASRYWAKQSDGSLISTVSSVDIPQVKKYLQINSSYIQSPFLGMTSSNVSYLYNGGYNTTWLPFMKMDDGVTFTQKDSSTITVFNPSTNSYINRNGFTLTGVDIVKGEVYVDFGNIYTFDGYGSYRYRTFSYSDYVNTSITNPTPIRYYVADTTQYVTNPDMIQGIGFLSSYKNFTYSTLFHYSFQNPYPATQITTRTSDQRIDPKIVDTKGNGYGYGATDYNFWAPYSLVKFDAITGGIVWRVDEPSYQYQHDPVGISKDGQYLIDSYKYANKRIDIRRTSDGSLVRSLSGAYTFMGFYDDIIVFCTDGEWYSSRQIYGYDLNLNQVWTSSNFTFYNAFEQSADGYILNLVGGKVSSINIKNGARATITDLPIPAYPGCSQNFIGKVLRLTSDGKIFTRTSCEDSSGTNYYYEYVISSTPTSGQSFSNESMMYPSTMSDLTDFNYQLSIKYNSTLYGNRKMGFSFKIKDYLNMYRVEIDQGSISLVKILNGTRTVLQTIGYTFNPFTNYTFKVNTVSNRHKIYVNGVPIIDVTDSSILSGKFGIWTQMERVQFSNLSYSDLSALSGNTTTLSNVVLVGSPVTYGTSYTDPENDPIAWENWHYVQNQKFLDAGDGYSGWSSLNGSTTGSPVTTFDKVGLWNITRTATDDPNPNYRYPSNVFNNYRQPSNTYQQNLVVSRKPLARFTVGTNGDGTIWWNDQSYDPDRWLSPMNYSTEPTGIDYQATRGVVNKRYMYDSPSGSTSYGQLTRPQETGTYTVYEAVQNEYGIWSDWYSQTVGSTVVVPNNPPSATLTFPSGSQAIPSYVSTLTPTIQWNQTDPDAGTTFAQFEVLVKDEWGNTVIDVTQPQGTSSTLQQWTLNQNLTMGQKYQVQVRTNDGIDWSAWSNIGWMITNRPPSTTMTYPTGVSAASPTIMNTLRPTFQWNQTDPDSGTTFTYFQMQITNEANNVMVQDTGQFYQGTTSNLGSWMINQDLPAGQKLRVRVRVFDGVTWSDYSAQTWFYINRAPVAEFDWSPKPVWEGDVVQITNTSFDSDGDALTYQWKLEQPDGATITSSSKDISHRFLKPGVYKVTLAVSDGLLSSTVVKMIAAMPLTIHSDVTYTNNWLLLHEKSGHQTVTVPKEFYSGEIFIVSSKSSPAPVDEVTAWMDSTGLDGHSIYVSQRLVAGAGDATSFSGEIFDAKFQSFAEGLPQGLQTIHFQIRYRNGVVKTEDIPVQIIGNVNKSAGVHRVQ